MKRAPMRIRLTLDYGLAAYIRAYARGIGIYGGERETIIAFIREAVIDRSKSDRCLQAMYPHLPRDIQRAWAHRKIKRS